MTNKYSLEEKTEAIAKVNALGGGMKSAKKVASEYNVHYTTVYGWMSTNGKKAKASKPKAKRTVKAKPTDAWQAAFDEYIENRDAASEALKKAEVAKKKLEKIVKELK